MKTSPIQEITSLNQKISYGMIAWKLFLLSLLLLGIMSSLLGVLGEKLETADKMFTITGAAVTATGGILCCVLAQIWGKKYRFLKVLYFCPWVILVLLTTPVSVVLGCSAWVNAWIRGYNEIHEGGIAMLSYSATIDDIRAFVFCMALLTAQLLWCAVVYNQMWAVYLSGLFWVIVPLSGGSFHPAFCGSMLAGTLGLSMIGGRKGLWKVRTVWTMIITLSLILCAVFVPQGELQSVLNFKNRVTEAIRVFRYGERTLPQGDLYHAGELQQAQGEMLQVNSAQCKAFYLKNYTGGDYENGCFRSLTDADYGGEYAGMLKWLSRQEFDPFTQVAEYYALGAEEDRPETNELQIQVIGAERSGLYVPSSLAGTVKGRSREKNDQWIESRGIRGMGDYCLQEVSGSRPGELSVTAAWVSSPQNDAQQNYVDAEAVYRSFVYDKYTEIDSGMYDLMQQWFWEDYTSDTDGIYSAIIQIRNKLRDRTFYTPVPDNYPAEEDPVTYFLTQSRHGNAMLFAATAVEALRAHGIPARYAEGYYISEQSLADSENGTVIVLGEDAHAWAEVYFDGIGWLPVDVTPGYYYDAVKLQQMVATPDMTHKTMAVDNNRMDAERVADNGTDTETTVSETVTTVIRNLAAFWMGIAAVVFLAVVFMMAAAEMLRALFLWQENRAYDRKTSGERVVDMEQKLLYFLKIRGIEARLGWNTDAVEEEIIQRNPQIRTGEYRRVCELLQKTIYGNICLEPYEERTVNYFLHKLYHPEPGSSIWLRGKLRYGIVGYKFEYIGKKQQRSSKKIEKRLKKQKI